MSEYASPPHLNPTPPPIHPPRAKSSGSGCWKIALILGIMALLSFGLLILGGITFAKKGLATDPVKVEAAADTMLEVDPGERWEPVMAMNMGIMRIAAFNETNQEGSLMMFEGSKSMYGDVDKFEKQMEIQMSSQDSTLESLREVGTKRREVTIAGNTYNMKLIESEGEESGARYITAAGVVPSKKAGKLVYLQYTLAAPDDDAAVAELERLLP